MMLFAGKCLCYLHKMTHVEYALLTKMKSSHHCLFSKPIEILHLQQKQQQKKPAGKKPICHLRQQLSPTL